MAPTSLYYNTRNTYEGVFVFNKNSIIIHWILFRTPTTEEKPGFTENFLVYYTRNGDILEIRHSGTLLVNMSGIYKKVR